MYQYSVVKSAVMCVNSVRINKFNKPIQATAICVDIELITSLEVDPHENSNYLQQQKTEKETAILQSTCDNVFSLRLASL